MVDHLMALWAYHHAHGPKRIMVHIEAAITERDEAVARINELENELERVKSRVDGAEIAQVGWKERAEKAEADTRRMDWLERYNCWIGVYGEYDIGAQWHGGGTESESLRAVVDAALADDPPRES